MKNYIKLNKQMKKVNKVNSKTSNKKSSTKKVVAKTPKVKNTKLSVYKDDKGKVSSVYLKIQKGVYQTSLKTFTVRKTVKGKLISAIFTSKTKAIQYYKGL